MRERLDALLVARGRFATRAQARAAILAGEVRVGDRVADKPGSMIDAEAVVSVSERPRFVSRGGDKLDHALVALGVDVAGEDVCDLGSSTGGFVDRLLQGGAARVVAVDVGYGQLDWRLREDPRVTVLERTNARHLTRDRLPVQPVVCHRRPVVHLPDGGSGRRARIAARRLPGPRARQAAVRGRPRPRGQRRSGPRSRGPGGGRRLGGRVAGRAGRRGARRLRLGASRTERQRGVLRLLL